MIIQKLSETRLKEISKLKQKKYREETNSFLIESEKIILEALKSNWNVKEIYILKDKLNILDNFKHLPSFKECCLFDLSEKNFKKISNDVTPSGIAALVQKKQFNLDDIAKSKPDFVPVFERISDPGNLGTVIRSADWFGFNSLVLSKESVEVTNPKVVKASMGSIFHMQIFSEVELNSFFSKMKSYGYKIFGTSTNGKDIRKVKLKDKVLIVFGNESKGLSNETLRHCDEIISIPPSGLAESLNLAISASIIFYEISRQLNVDKNL